MMDPLNGSLWKCLIGRLPEGESRTSQGGVLLSATSPGLGPRMRAVMTAPVGRRDVHGRRLAGSPEEIEAFARPLRLNAINSNDSTC